MSLVKPDIVLMSNDTTMMHPWGADDFAVVFANEFPTPLVVRCTDTEYVADDGNGTMSFRWALETVWRDDDEPQDD